MSASHCRPRPIERIAERNHPATHSPFRLKAARRRASGQALPAGAKRLEVEITQARDLDLNRRRVMRAGNFLGDAIGRAAFAILPAAPPIASLSMRYRLTTSTCSETRLSLSFLRTTPAKKLRTEYRCHPVSFMMASMVAPSPDRSSAGTFACLLFARVKGAEDGKLTLGSDGAFAAGFVRLIKSGRLATA